MKIGFLGEFPRSRVAVSALFFINGLLIGAWAPMIPPFKQRLALSESEMGIVILALGIGAVISMPAVGVVISRYGTKLPATYLTICCSTGLVLAALAPSLAFAALFLFLLGGTWAGMDVAMNSNVIEVEQSNKIPIMSTCHGFWSIGGLTGAFFGGFTLTLLGELGHGIFWMVVFLLIAAFALSNLEAGSVSKSENTEKPKLQFPRSVLPFMLGAIALFSVVPEGVVLDWSALFLNEERGFSIALAGLGFAAFSTAMGIMRFLGDAIRKKYGAVLTLRVSVILAIFGFGVIATFTNQAVTISGFFIAGLGMANLFPIAISAAGNLPNIPSGIAVSMVTSVGYGGILLAPPAFGVIAQIWDYNLVFTIMPFCLLIVFFMLSAARYADVENDD